ncbi:hypothetical protein [Streptomyces sp. NPDC001933]|uniref:hypothetical protein n=1 Tax=Streptomyces sp. NPDC001933 TaxID=3364626 RepID=UPI00369A6A12
MREAAGLLPLVSQEGEGEIESVDLTPPVLGDSALATGEEVLLQLIQAGQHLGVDAQHRAADAGIRCPVLQLDPQQRPRLIEIIRNLRERITEARANGWLGEVEGLQVSRNAAMAKFTSLNRTSTDGRPQLVDLGMPVFTDDAPPPQPAAREPETQG